MDYYFGEQLRWNLGWDTPNQAGAFVATLLPLFWVLVAWVWRRIGCAGKTWAKAAWSLGLLVVGLAEALGIYTLARTYSRGALAGLVIGAAAWGVLAAWRRASAKRGSPGNDGAEGEELGKGAWWVWGTRGVVLVGVLAMTGFHARIAPEHIAEDRSSLNRLVLWRGGAELVAASPLRGWGWGESGAAFMHWTQPLDRSEGYLSMVNSYLTVAVEAGLPWFAVLLAVAMLPLARAWGLVGSSAGFQPASGKAGSLRYSGWLAGLAAIWATWLGCLIFSNLWIIRGLWIVPCFAGIALLAAWPHRGLAWRYAVASAAAGAVATAMGVWVLGGVWAGSQPVRLERLADGRGVLIERVAAKEANGEAVSPGRVLVVPDADVLGESYGQELRRWLLTDARVTKLRVLQAGPELRERDLAEVDGILLCGAGAEVLSQPALAGAKGPIWVLHPTVPPSDSAFRWSGGGAILLPGIDISGQAAPWWAWAAQAEPPVPVRLSAGLANDARPRWPDIVVQQVVELRPRTSH